MKTNIFSKTILAVALTAATLVSCDSDVFDVNGNPFEGTTYIASDSITSPIALILESDPDFTEYVKALRYSGTFNALNQSTPGISFTALAPNNDAMHDFYRRRGVDSLENLSPEYMRQFVLYHTLPDSIPTKTFVTKNSVTNLTNDILDITIDSIHAGEAQIGGEGHIIEMGIDAYNGKIYILSSALTPLVETVYDRIVESGTSSIMKEAIEAAGLANDLQTLADTIVENGAQIISNRYYTFLNVPDATFSASGINSVADLRAKLSARDDREGVTADSLLREYVSYHILPSLIRTADLGEATGEELATKLLSTMAKNRTIMLAIDPAGTEIANTYTFNHLDESAALVAASSDIRAKNGYIHTLSSWLPVWEPEQTEVVWDLADYPEVRSIVEKQDPELYQPAVAVTKETSVAISNAKCYIVETTESKNTSYGAVTYMTTKSYKLLAPRLGEITTAFNNDRVIFNLGYLGSVEMETPTLVKGKYRVEISVGYLAALNFMRKKSDGNGGLLKFTFDGRDDATVFATPYTKIDNAFTTGGIFTTELMAEVEFDETSTHSVKMMVMDPAATSNKSSSIQIDCIRFIPIK